MQKLTNPPNDIGPRFIQVDAQADRADLVLTTAGNVYHSQFLPGLTLKATPSRWRADRRQRVTFKVTDAGEAVAGATVRAAGERCRTRAAAGARHHRPTPIGLGDGEGDQVELRAGQEEAAPDATLRAGSL